MTQVFDVSKCNYCENRIIKIDLKNTLKIPIYLTFWYILAKILREENFKKLP